MRDQAGNWLGFLCEWLCGVQEGAELGAPFVTAPLPENSPGCSQHAGRVPMAGRPPVSLCMEKEGFEGLFGGLFLPSALLSSAGQCLGVLNIPCVSPQCWTSVLMSFLLWVVAAWCENPWGGSQNTSMEYSVTALLLVGNLIAKKKKNPKKIVISYTSSAGLLWCWKHDPLLSLLEMVYLKLLFIKSCF